MDINKDELSVFSDLSCLPKIGENKVISKPAQPQKNLINNLKNNPETLRKSSDTISDSSSENMFMNISHVSSNMGSNIRSSAGSNIRSSAGSNVRSNASSNVRSNASSNVRSNPGSNVRSNQGSNYISDSSSDSCFITSINTESCISSNTGTNASTNTSCYTSVVTSPDDDSSCTTDNSSNGVCKNLLNEIVCKEKILNKIHIDVAVVSEDYNNIELMCEDHIINLDEIDITMDMFQLMFYPYKENFGLNKDFFINNNKFIPFISFFPDFRSVNGKKFYLLEQIISNIETDLNVPRYCFTKDSLVELTNQITCIKTLLDIKCCSVLSSLTWTNILDIIRNYTYIHEKVIPILVVNIVFKTPTTGVKDTVIRFQYKICK